MIDINLYHWIWYLLGFLYAPKLTVMIWISIYFKSYIPLPLFVIGWIIAVIDTVHINYKEK